MNVSLTSKLEEFIEEKVRSGRYTSASEVVREALRLLETQDLLRNASLERVRSDIRTGLAELGRGESVSAEEVFADLEREQQKLESRARPD